MDAAQQKAFEEYMLGGKKKTSSSNTPPPSAPSTRVVSSKKKRVGKQVGPIFKAFQGRLEEWKDVDDQSKAVLGSIANLRDRIWWESCQLLEQNKKEDKVVAAGEWQVCGFRGRTNLLRRDDVEMALTHDLLQHEKMLAGARTLISSLAQIQEGLGRRLDEWMMYQLEDGFGASQVLLDQCQEAYLWLAGELYRKQMMVQEILDSCHVGLLEKDAKQSLEQEGTPRVVGRRCYNRWSPPRGKQEWLVVEKVLKRGSSVN